MAPARTTKRTELSRERVVAVALELLDDEGVEALRMRRLAEALGVGTMSIYHYVQGKADLTEAVLEQVLTELPRPRADMAWIDVARGMATSFRQVALDHPAAFKLLLTVQPPAASVVLYAEVIESLHRAGLGDDDIRRLFRAVFRFVIGWCLSEVADLPGSEERRAKGDGDFAFALDALLDGLELRLVEG